MIVLMTSCEPNRAFNTPGMAPQQAPLRIAARQVSGIRIQAELFAKVMPAQAVAKAAMVS